MTAAAAPRLVRETYSVSRLSEFASERELTAQIGHGIENWPLVVGKELVDNALDAAEESDIASMISVEVSTDRGLIVVTDNGPGIRPETVEALCDYSRRTSSRAHIVSPSRGQQGNAWQAILAAAFVLDGARGETTVEAHGITHRIGFEVDPIRREPRISYETGASGVKIGTRVTFRWPDKGMPLLDRAKGRFLQILDEYGWLNPHVELAGSWDGKELVKVLPTDPAWPKWGPSEPTSPHWYSPGRLENLIGAQVARDQDLGRSRLVREFVADFRGLAGTAKQREVLGETGLSRQPLVAFFAEGKVDQVSVIRLLAAMERHSRPVKPADLGIIGKEHFAWCLSVDECTPASVRYHRVLGDTAGHLPFVVEAAFGARPPGSGFRRIITGINWSPAIRNPFRYLSDRSLADLLADQHLGLDEGAGTNIGIHLAIPQATHTDRGKSAIVLPRECAAAITEAVRRVTRDWCETRKTAERDQHRARRTRERQTEAREKAERAAKREKNEIVGTGVLYAEIAAAAAASGLSINALTVLSSESDPYRHDTRDGHRDGAWFADQVGRFITDPEKKIHLRGLHYLIASAADVRRPDGSRFVNSFDCWKWLQGHASYAARWLGLVPLERIRDERNEAPRVISYAASPIAGSGYLTTDFAIDLPQVGTLMPHLSGMAPSVPQPFRIIFIGEKSSLAEVLQPIAQEVAGELLLPTGEPSITMIAEMAARAAADPRPAVVCYFSDFDPSGAQMPISVARKLQALRTKDYPDLRVQVHHVALTIDQVRRFGLPSTPLKRTEKRADKWRGHHGHEQTEIDALAALRPDELRRIALEAIAPFYDFTLAQRCRAEFHRWHSEAAIQLLKHPARAGAEQKIRAAFKGVEKARGTLMRAQGDALRALHGAISRAEFTTLEVEIKASPPSPLFTAEDDFVTATRKLIASKALEAEDDEP